MATIFIVGNDITLRDSICNILLTNGYQVETANSGKEGLEKAKNILPDLILSDITLSDMDGYQLLREFQKVEYLASVPFIFLTSAIENGRRVMNTGADDYLIKPFNTEDLLLAVQARLNKKKIYERELNNLKESFVTKVPHELRTPLVGILGFSELIKEEIQELSQEEIIDYVSKINESGRRLLKRIEKFLLYVELLSDSIRKLRQNRNDLFNCFIDEELIRFIIKPILRDFNREGDVELYIQPSKVNIYEKYFHVIVNELVENAVKYSEPSSKIFIKSKIENNSYNITIVNNGMEFSKHFNKYDAYKQITEKNNIQESIGLGLAIVKKIIEQSNGFLTIERNFDNKTDNKTIVIVNLKLSE